MTHIRIVTLGSNNLWCFMGRVRTNWRPSSITSAGRDSLTDRMVPLRLSTGKLAFWFCVDDLEQFLHLSSSAQVKLVQICYEMSDTI